MSSEHFEHVTTEATVASYEASVAIFESLLSEVRLLSKKKPEATMSASKVKTINRVLEDLLAFLKKEPTGKYLEVLDDKTLPQVSDAVLAMVQFEATLSAFRKRYHRLIGGEFGDYFWITSELLERRMKEAEERSKKRDMPKRKTRDD